MTISTCIYLQKQFPDLHGLIKETFSGLGTAKSKIFKRYPKDSLCCLSSNLLITISPNVILSLVLFVMFLSKFFLIKYIFTVMRSLLKEILNIDCIDLAVEEDAVQAFIEYFLSRNPSTMQNFLSIWGANNCGRQRGCSTSRLRQNGPFS